MGVAEVLGGSLGCLGVPEVLGGPWESLQVLAVLGGGSLWVFLGIPGFLAGPGGFWGPRVA